MCSTILCCFHCRLKHEKWSERFFFLLLLFLHRVHVYIRWSVHPYISDSVSFSFSMSLYELASHRVKPASTIFAIAKLPSRYDTEHKQERQTIPSRHFRNFISRISWLDSVVAWACLHKSMFLPPLVRWGWMLPFDNVFTTEICHQTFSSRHGAAHSRWKLKLWCFDFQIRFFFPPA